MCLRAKKKLINIYNVNAGEKDTPPAEMNGQEHSCPSCH